MIDNQIFFQKAAELQGSATSLTRSRAGQAQKACGTIFIPVNYNQTVTIRHQRTCMYIILIIYNNELIQLLLIIKYFS